ncbi:TPA: methyltransferase domain-containing protein [Kluyvera ascorbata]|uniref:SAM-dependent methyltransferase n=1 Tax=Kluyvera genomosp. 2 TaxID=2774054 RepID=A0A2T2XZ97_9ENTR|nr:MULTISPECIES: class I SAM-dependent methyltransferase [Enterobacteriaceae]HAT3919313.1 methyltransferase domain-containing protein [Kluyvera ascorbata]PSR45577.1 SAM-dependent methyltransferase [Kluyvera genomosp. 2]BBQ84480.1 O-methyltransferase [Klebsiella sp. WP3-W18-ESBL-02]BBR21532.1 O-methyltransferase [Klebsiella sp. WP3-S18-ESBL-05]HAT3944762.1 methyltransferase domain-containing protein [Kluyvera ascorbata]
MYEQDSLSALEAITEAQKIAFAPMLFQTALSLRNTGILAYLDKQGKNGATLSDIAAQCPLNEYAISILLDMGLSGRIVTAQNDAYCLTKIGHFLLHDKMTNVNMDFTQDVCYQGLFFLEQALKEGKPSGLKVFGDWPTIYPALSQLPESARASWFAFDHYYSDEAFAAALPRIFASNPTILYDVGGNTGKWALHCCQYNDNITVTILDLPPQITLARANIANAGLTHRVNFHPVDMLSAAPLPGEADIWWMSQFLDCFSPEQIIALLANVARAMKPGAKLCIMELFWDAQKFEAAAFSLNATSLYFTCMANGNSRFYSVEKFYHYLDRAGFQVDERHDNLGIGHTLLICHKKSF